MENTAILNKYEMMVIVNAGLSKDQKDAIIKSVTDAIEKVGAKVINTQIWQEKHRFTFPVKKCKEGTYYMINFESPGPALIELKSILRINEQILRLLILKQDA